MTTPVPAPGESRTRVALRQHLVRLGVPRSTLLVTLLATLFAVGLSQVVVGVLGHGERWLIALAAALPAFLITPPASAFAIRMLIEAEKTRALVDILTTRDELTGVFNRPYFMSAAQREWERARRYGTASAMLMIDADHFRRVNDAHGQLCGDEVLRRMAQEVGASLRQADVLARFGGEELIVFLPHTDPLGALDVAERVRSRVQDLVVDFKGEQVRVTVSVGMAPMRNELPTLDWMIHEADTALQAAKADGRNCVRTLPFEASRSGGAFPVNLR